MNAQTQVNDAVLSEYDFIVVVDASGSMGTEDMAGGRSRWNYMQESLAAFTRDVGRYDSDGVDLVLFGGQKIDTYAGVTSTSVPGIFASREPRGGTPLAEALTAALKLAGKSQKKDFVLVFTDGAPDDKAAAARVIADASQKLSSDDELTFLFVQVGRDHAATAFLRSLDDDLKGAKFDIVDTKTMDEAEAFPSTAALVAAAIND